MWYTKIYGIPRIYINILETLDMLELKHINYSVSDHEGTTNILSDISLTVPDGQLAVFTGPNGGGKTTLAKIIMGLVTPTSGSIYYNGEDITAAYIGGSITEGYNAGTTEFYAKTCTDLLQGYFPDITVTGVNAGISGTPSLLGNLRLERDVLSADPDIVFVEFAVNDGQEQDYKNAYESLVRTLLTQDKDIAVVLLFTVLDNGYTCQEHMSKIGANYELPMISVHDSVYEEIEAGRMTWQDYSNDQSHPNEYGHKCITDFVDNYYQKVLPVVAENAGTVDKNLPDPVFSGKYMNMHYMDRETMEGVELDGFKEYDTHSSFHNGWMYKGTSGGSIKFSLSCSVLEMVFKAQNSAKYGAADIYVDGEKVKSVDANMSDGWDNPVTAYLIDDTQSAEHTVEIRMEPGEAQAYFVLAFGYCD